MTKYGVHITSDVKVTAYYQVLSPCSQDVYALKGSAALGTLFYVPMIHDSYYYTGAASNYPSAYDQIDIVATEDDTEVRVIPKAAIRVGGSSWAAGTELVRTLNQGETLKIMENTPLRTAGSASLGGTRISATHPVAVTTTEDLIGRPTSPATGQDVIGDQIVPVSSLGKKYVVVKGFMAGSERVYMIATENNTVITVNTGSAITSSTTLSAGSLYMFNMGNGGNIGTDPDVVTVTANYPFYCYQITGVCNSNGRDELGSALLPSIYSVSQTKTSFYQYSAASSDYSDLFLLFRDGSEGDFSLSYGNTTVTPQLTTMPIPDIPDWKAAKYRSPAVAANQVVTIRNASSMFALGCFSTNITTGGASFGYLSAFGNVSFPDTTYKCIGTGITLDAGYAANYDWTLPDNTTATTATVIATDTGRYTVTVNQDPITFTISTVVLDRFGGASIVSSGGNDAGAGAYTYSVDLDGQSAAGVSYLWNVDGVQVSTEATYSVTWNDTDEKPLTVEITDTDLGCTQTLSRIHHRLPDNVNPAQCFILPPGTTFGIDSLSSRETDLSPYQNPLVGDMNGDGVPEIITATDLTNAQPFNTARQAKKIAIYRGDDIKAAPRLITTTKPYIWDLRNRYVLYKTKINSRDTVLIAVMEMDSVMRAYNYDGVRVWESPRQTRMREGGNQATPSVADLNHDGIPEIIVIGHVFNSATGALICSAPGTNVNDMLAVDVFNTGHLNCVQQNSIYDVTLDASGGITGLKLNKSLSPPVFAAGDADNPTGTDFTPSTNVRINYVDIDNDGRLDCIFQGNGTVASTIRYNIVYIVDPYTDTVKARQVFVYNALAGGASSSLQFVGDMDGDGLPEIAFIRGGTPSPYYDMELVAM
ncbi:MAG: IgGFc-binding protein, partial [Tannerella sp.]|nr:IgGFc-binding protein [Tannerella sp.]